MTRTRHIHFTAFAMLLGLSLLVAFVPVASVFAHPQATPVVESPTSVTPEDDQATSAESNEDNPAPGESDAPEDVNGNESEVSTMPTAPETDSGQEPRDVEPRSSGSSVSLSNCAAPQGALSPGESLSFNCTLTKVGGFPFAGVTYTDPGPNFTVAVSANPAMGSATSGRAHTFELPARNGTRSVQLTITISAVATTPLGATFDTSFQACNPSGNSMNSNCVATGSNFQVSMPIADPVASLEEGTDYTFECNDFVREPGGAWATASSTCTVTALGDAPIRLDKITWTSTGSAGWEMTIADRAVSTSGEPISLSNIVVDNFNPHSFDVSMTPVGCEANASPLLTVSVQVSPVGQSTSADTSAGVTFAPTFEAPTPEASAILIATPGTVRALYSMTTDQDRSTSFTARYTVSGCQNWTGSAQMSPFTPASSSQGPHVPVLKSATPGATDIAGTGSTTVQPAELNTIATVPTMLVSGTAPGEPVVVEQDINLEYTVPANTTIGTYESTVTVSITAAP